MSRSTLPIHLILVAAIGLLCCHTAALADEVNRRDLFARNIKGCVGVMTAGGPASGFVVDVKKRWIVTCQHVAGAKDEVEIVFPSTKEGKLIQERTWYLKTAPRIKGKVISTDAKRDLCLIEAESLPQGTAAMWLAPDSGQPGDSLNLIGNPAASGAMWNYSTGTLRAVYKKKFIYKNTTHEVEAVIGETQLPANPGDSGGAVFNDRGEVLGIHSGGTPDGIQLMATYIDVVEIRKFLSEPFKAVAKASSSADYFAAGNDFFLHNEIDKAIEAYSQAIKLKPDHSEAWRCRASAYLRKKIYDKALEDCNEAVRTDRANAKAYNERAVCHGAKGDLKTALGDYNEAVRLDPKDPMFWAGRAWTLNGLKEHQKAIADATEAIRLKADFVLAWTERGLAHFSLKDYDKATKDFTEALILYPQDSQLWLLRSQCHKHLGNSELANADLQRAKTLNPAIGRGAN